MIDPLEAATNEVKNTYALKGRISKVAAKALGKRLGAALDAHNAVVANTHDKRFGEDLSELSKLVYRVATRNPKHFY